MAAPKPSEAENAAAQHAQQHWRRRPMTIQTGRAFDEGGAGAYIAHHRDRRLRKGDIFLRRCAVLFMLSLTGIMKTRQYSIEYYLCWISTYVSFFFMLPSVLPSDNVRIRAMLLVAVWNMSCATAFAVRFARRKHSQLEHCTLLRWVCLFNVGFWSVHAFIASALAASSLYSFARRSPADGLHRFWWDFGVYFTLLACVSSADLAAVYCGGKYHLPEYRVAFWGNVAITLVQFAIGRLCHSNAFKFAMWRYAASIASIRARNVDRPAARGLAFWILPSVTFVFFGAILAAQRRALPPPTPLGWRWWQLRR